MSYTRRDFLGKKGLLAAASLSLVSKVACKTSRKRQEVTNQERHSTVEDVASPSMSTKVATSKQANASSNQQASQEKQATPTASSCVKELSTRLSLEKIAFAPELYQVALKSYGNARSCLVALDLPKYQHGSLQDIFIVRTSGKLVAQYGISDIADVRSDRRLRPILFENLSLGSDLRIVVVFLTLEGKFLRSDIKNLNFENIFEGYRVYGPSLADAFANSDLPSQAQPYFKIDASSYEHIEGQEQGIDAGFETVFLTSDDLRNYIVTDFMGNVLARYGEFFNSLVEHPYFICYRFVETYYIRTLVKIV